MINSAACECFNKFNVFIKLTLDHLRLFHLLYITKQIKTTYINYCNEIEINNNQFKVDIL